MALNGMQRGSRWKLLLVLVAESKWSLQAAAKMGTLGHVPMEIRLLTQHDSLAWWHLRLLALKDAPHSFAESVEEHRSRNMEETQKYFCTLDAENFIVGLFEDDELAGMAGFYRHKHAKFRHKGTVWGVYVRPESRGKGAAKAMLQELIRCAKKISGLERILLVVAAPQEKARRLYESLGFRRYGVEPQSLKVGERYIDDELMVLHLHRT
jgi:RimJ/RimL family protein N-acetyltransferase